ncbi:MAG TPA: biosynthetic peptidoglycan transglycosylase [Methylibium sp.]|uniref:biosynthetic peptidoglycan transglycosylase n=1 Tax=Methylibium sp. TaxID=2067992 RepID=UPI002DB769DA|nr:biosynthetic peptidoglycan transglycosylase [Methylibium sp.]HEU4458240.1 biosynthetic peptidoglycan transglycosylase [Methylibium sp.]
MSPNGERAATRAAACGRCAGLRAALRALLWSALAASLVAGGFVAFALHVLKAQPGEWSQRVRLGPIERELGVAPLIRVATHPLGLAALDGRTIDGRRLGMRWGRWRLERRAADTLVATCAPCSVELAALGASALVLPRAQLRLTRAEVDRYRGELVLGEREGEALRIHWQAKLAPEGLAIDAELPPQPIARAAQALGAAQVPELGRARIDGTLRGGFAWKLPGGAIKPSIQLAGFGVAGLGTEALLDAALPAGCGRAASKAPRVVGWLPRAVVAAEDQRFFEHPGYDLAQLLAAWSANAGADQGAGHAAAGADDGSTPAGADEGSTPAGADDGSAPAGVNDGSTPAGVQGASTLTQQLAKRVFVGDERSAARKLRELLYAVEMERTLGKARILQLYLRLAPWGGGLCGADAAARAHLQKSVERLTPLEAAWLASLLRDGGRALAQGSIDRGRLVFVLQGMRGPLPLERRAEQIERARTWLPPALRER